MLTLHHFLSTLTQTQALGQDVPIASVVIDSREAVTGSLFVAFNGEHVDGHDYVASAFERGAVCAIVEKPIPNFANIQADETATALTLPVCIVVENTMQSLQASAKAWRARFTDLTVVGITGSVGKTSTKELMHSVLASKYHTLKTAGSRNNEIGLPLTLLELNEAHEMAVLEMGMYTRGEIALLCELAQPQVGVLTIVGPVHLERVGSMEGIVLAKQELVEALPDDGLAILNYDDERVMSMAQATSARIFTYGLDAGADLWADEITSMGLEGVRFTLHYGNETLRLHVPLLGRHSVHTALRATAVALNLGLSWEEIIVGLQQRRDQLRLVATPGINGSTMIDDTYNASPDSMLAALNLLQDLEGRRLAVLGDMLELGRAEEVSHRLVGRRVADVADLLVAVGTRSRWLAEEAEEVGMTAVYTVDTPTQAIDILRPLIQAGDYVLVKGSLGMQMESIVTTLGDKV